MRARMAIRCALVFLAGCAGETSAAPQARDAASDVPSAAQATGDAGSGEAGAVVFAGCREASTFDHTGPDVRACTVGRALLRCTGDAGLACVCASEDTAGCLNDVGIPWCGTAQGFTCQNLCGPAEYAVACGGPPLLLPATYQVPPAACRLGSANEEVQFFCCPCE
jgi:hypothetical protein